MGLSRKLGTSAARGNEAESTTVLYKWSTQTYTIAEILTKFKLPCVVQCATDSCSVVWSDFQFDLRQPLLLYEKRTVQKVHAVSVSMPKAKPGTGHGPDPTEPLEEVGPPMAIPCDYEGWFGSAPKGQPKMSRHTRIQGVANSKARRFLVTTKLPAFTSSRSPGGARSGDLDGYVPHDVMPGEVLKRVCVLDPKPGDPDCPALVRQNGPCLECLDEKDEDVVIPLSRRAIIYEIGEVYPGDIGRIFTMAPVVAAGNSTLPRVVKLVHGEPPLLAYAFTGLLRCYSVFTEETILAATLDDTASICLELATDSCAKFRLCLNEVSMKRTCEYGNALHMCDTFGAKFVTGIKVSFSLQPETADLDDIDLSFYESQNSFSDMQEVEANSEFEFSWGAVKKAKLLSTSSDLDLQTHEANKEESSSGEEDSFLEGSLPMGRRQKKGENSDGSEPFAAINKEGKMSGHAPGSPQQRDFTEKEIADLMQRKGMIATTDRLEDDKAGLLGQDNKVRYNPLYFYFEREAEEQGESNDSEGPVSGSVKTNGVAEVKDSSSGTDHVVAVQDALSSTDGLDLPDVVIKPAQVVGPEKGGAEEGEDGAQDTSMYEEVVCTPAREYSEDEVVDSDSSDDNNNDSSDGNNDNDSDILYDKTDSDSHQRSSTFEKTKTQFPVEANVVVKAVDKRATTRSYVNIPTPGGYRRDHQGHKFYTSSSDDVNSDLDRMQRNKGHKGIQNQRSQTENKASTNGAYSREIASETHNSNSSFSCDDSSGLSSEKDNGKEDDAGAGREGRSPLAACSPKPTFTEVDDPLETTMSELDKVTSIKPSGLLTEPRGDGGGAQSLKDSSPPLKTSNVSLKTSDNNANKSVVEMTKKRLEWKSEDNVSKSTRSLGGRARQKTTSLTKQASTRPLVLHVSNRKHADVMQEEDRFDSPKVSHHPHVHPHTPAYQHGPPTTHTSALQHVTHTSALQHVTHISALQHVTHTPAYQHGPPTTHTPAYQHGPPTTHTPALQHVTHTSALQHGPPGTLHLGRWTKPVPLGGAATDNGGSDNSLQHSQTKAKLVDSVQNVASLQSSTFVNIHTPGNTDNKPALILAGQNSKLVKNSSGEGSNSDRENNSQMNSLHAENGSVPRERITTTQDLNQSFEPGGPCGTAEQVDSDPHHPPPTGVRVEDDSDEEVTTIEEHFVVCADSTVSSGAALKVLPVYHEDLNSENFVFV